MRESHTAIFADEANIVSAGATQKPACQVRANKTLLRLRMDGQHHVASSRVIFYLSLDFDRTVYDAIRPVVFMLLRKPRISCRPTHDEPLTPRRRNAE